MHLLRTCVASLTGCLLFASASRSFAADPATPEAERLGFFFADPDLTADLVAAEPDVLSPVAMAWDAAGRLYVAEMRDYPNAKTSGAIRRLEDRDGDGRYETSVVFAENIPFPNGVLPWNGGILVTAAPDILFLRDTNGDGRADERTVVLTGFGTGNQQLRVNGLYLGLDNWIYGANGRSDGEIHSPGRTNRVSIRGRDFRFRPATGEIETLAGRSQFGLAHDDWGNRFLSWNTIPLRHEVFPDRFLSRARPPVDADVLVDTLPAADSGEVFPATPAPLVFNNESSGHFNALSGLSIHRGRALGEAYDGNAFVGESLRNLVHRRVLKPHGVTFTGERAEAGREFLASKDPWFHPVQFATGPDGALYIADFYRQFVEHPDWVSRDMREKVDWRIGSEHGRIWRVHHKQWKQPVENKLEGATTAELVASLASDNGWRRDTARRLLAERQDPDSVTPLRALLGNRASPIGQALALHTLNALKALEGADLSKALSGQNPRVLEQALQICAEQWEAGQVPARISEQIVELARHADPRVRLWAVLAGARLDPEPRLVLLSAALPHLDSDRWLRWAIQASADELALPLLDRIGRNLQGADTAGLPMPGGGPAAGPAAKPTWSSQPSAEHLDLAQQLAASLFSPDAAIEVRRLARLERRFRLSLPTQAEPGTDTGALRLWSAFLTGAAEGLARAGSSIRNLQEWLKPANPATATALAADIDQLIAAAHSASAPLWKRRFGLKIASATGATLDLGTLLQASNPATPAGGGAMEAIRDYQRTAVRAFVRSADAARLKQALGHAEGFPQESKRDLYAAASVQRTGAEAMLGELEAGRLAWIDLEPATRASLAATLGDAGKARIASLTKAGSSPDRSRVIEQYRAALSLVGDRGRGEQIYVQQCASCHRSGEQGQRVGPDLAGVATRPRDALLIDLLDPSRQVTPDYTTQMVTTSSGETLSGLLASASENAIRLRRPGVPDQTILRADIREIQSSGRSLMPDGLESSISVQAMADLLEFLTGKK